MRNAIVNIISLKYNVVIGVRTHSPRFFRNIVNSRARLTSNLIRIHRQESLIAKPLSSLGMQGDPNHSTITVIEPGSEIKAEIAP